MINRRKFSGWVAKRQLVSPVAATWELWHLSRSTGDALVCGLNPTGAGDDLAASLEREASECATEHAESWDGRQQYAVRACSADRTHLGEFGFYLQGAALATRAVADLSEPVPELSVGTGGDMTAAKAIAMMVVQQMRHNEANQRIIMEMSCRTSERDGVMIANQQRHIETLETRRFESFEMREDLLSKEAERRLSQQRFEAEDARKTRIFDKLFGSVIPAIAAKWGFPGVGDESKGDNGSGFNVEKFKTIFLGLDGELQDAILKGMNEEDRDAMMDAFGFQRKKDASDAEPAEEAKH